jgi:hypothetical protein
MIIPVKSMSLVAAIVILADNNVGTLYFVLKSSLYVK